VVSVLSEQYIVITMFASCGFNCNSEIVGLLNICELLWENRTLN